MNLIIFTLYSLKVYIETTDLRLNAIKSFGWITVEHTPVGLCSSVTQLEVLLVAWPPGPPPLTNLSSRSSSTSLGTKEYSNNLLLIREIWLVDINLWLRLLTSIDSIIALHNTAEVQQGLPFLQNEIRMLVIIYKQLEVCTNAKITAGYICYWFCKCCDN